MPGGIGIGIVVVSRLGGFVAFVVLAAGRALDVSAGMPGIPRIRGMGAGLFGETTGFCADAIADTANIRSSATNVCRRLLKAGSRETADAKEKSEAIRSEMFRAAQSAQRAR